MKSVIICALILFMTTVSGQVSFDKYFNSRVLRFDYVFAGDSKNTAIYPMGMKEEPFWGGLQYQSH